QVVSPLTARLLWGLGVPSHDRQADLLQALHEVVDSYNLTVDTDELFVRMLEIAIGVTGAEGGSLMLVDETGGELVVRVAVGVERELWPKIRVPFGDRIAGREPLSDRLRRLCEWVAGRTGGGIATIYQVEHAAGGLRMVATSLAGGHLGGEYRVAPGRGIDGQVAQTRAPAFLRHPDGSVAYAALPLSDAEQLVGVLSIQCGTALPRGRAAE